MEALLRHHCNSTESAPLQREHTTQNTTFRAEVNTRREIAHYELENTYGKH